jgi:hypothetical protein
LCVFSGAAKKLRMVIFHNKQLKKSVVTGEIKDKKLNFHVAYYALSNTKCEALKYLLISREASAKNAGRLMRVDKRVSVIVRR